MKNNTSKHIINKVLALSLAFCMTFPTTAFAASVEGDAAYSEETVAVEEEITASDEEAAATVMISTENENLEEATLPEHTVTGYEEPEEETDAAEGEATAPAEGNDDTSVEGEDASSTDGTITESSDSENAAATDETGDDNSTAAEAIDDASEEPTAVDPVVEEETHAVAKDETSAGDTVPKSGREEMGAEESESITDSLYEGPVAEDEVVITPQMLSDQITVKQNNQYVPTNTSFDTAKVITAGSTIHTGVSSDYSSTYFMFIPKKTGTYSFASISDKFASGYLYDSDYNELYEDRVGRTSSDFLVRYDLKAGETYYYEAEVYTEDASYEYDVRLWKNTIGAKGNLHEYINIPAKDADKRITLSVEAESTNPITYTWSIDDVIIDCTTNTLTIVPDKNSYVCCTVSDGVDYFSKHFQIHIDNPMRATPEIVGGKKSTKEYIEFKVVYGSQPVMKANATASDASGITYQWQNQEGIERKDIDGANQATFTAPAVTMPTIYFCKVTDRFGNSKTVDFLIDIDNHLVAYPDGAERDVKKAVIKAKEGTNVTLKVNAEADDMDGLTFRWFSDDSDSCIGEGRQCEVRAVDGAVYQCSVLDRFYNHAFVTFCIVERTVPLSETQIALSKTSYTYNKRVLTPTVTLTYNGRRYTEGFTIAYSNKKSMDAGTYKVTVTGDGEVFSGKKTLTYTINQKAQSPSCTVSAVDVGTSKTFEVQKSVGTITATSSDTDVAKVSVSGTDITVTGVAVGTATITIKAAGDTNYKAKSFKVTAKIRPGKTTKLKAAASSDGKGIKLTWAKVKGATGYVIYRNNTKIESVGDVSTYTDAEANANGTKYTFKVYAKASTGTSSQYKDVTHYKVNRPAIKELTNSGKRKMTVQWAKNTKATGYQIQYGLEKNFSGAKSVDISPNTTVSKTIAKLTKGKTYYVRIRTYKTVGKKNYYSAWSAVKTVKIEK